MEKKTSVIEISDLYKSFKDVKVVNGLSFSVRKGELFAFLGVNGAGKSTTINIVSGVLIKDSGSVVVCGKDIDSDPQSVKSKIGIVFQNSVLDKRLSVYDNLKSRAALYGIFGSRLSDRLAEIGDLLELKDLYGRPLYKLSGGQRRRVDIARALVHRPELLILDEPTTGLDPQTRIKVWNVVEKLRKDEGLTVLLTTHYMEEAAVADYVVILDAGLKVAEGTPHFLKTKYAADYIRLYSNINEAMTTFKPLGLAMRRERDFLEIEVKDTSSVLKLIRSNPKIFNDFEVLKGNMDNVFLKVTGKDIKEA